MLRREPSIFLVFLLAVTVHVAVMGLAFEAERRGWRVGWFAIGGRARPAPDEVASVILRVDEPQQDPDEFQPGQHDGVGEGLDNRDADHRQTGHVPTEDQAWQSLDRQGDPSAQGRERGEAGDPGFQGPPQSMAATEFTPQALPRVGERSIRVSVPPSAHPNQSAPDSGADHPTTVEQTREPPKPDAVAAAAPASSGAPGTVAEAAAGNAAPESDRELSLFAKEFAVEVRAGKVVSREGREVKMGPIVLNLSARIDPIRLPVTLHFRVKTAADGKPLLVQAVDSTGSSSIDRAILLAMYQAWFEPLKDQQGRPLPDAFTFSMTMH